MERTIYAKDIIMYIMLFVAIVIMVLDVSSTRNAQRSCDYAVEVFNETGGNCELAKFLCRQVSAPAPSIAPQMP